MRWIHTPLPAAEVEEVCSRLRDVSPVLAELLVRNGLKETGAAEQFLQPALAGLQDPFLLVNMDAAVARLRRAIERRETLVVLGDYDVDGVSSTAFLVSVLRRFGLDPRFVVPRRLEEGYGLSRGAIDRALEAGRPDLFIALDCGTNSHDELAYLQAQGVDAIVIDHHRSKEKPLGRRHPDQSPCPRRARTTRPGAISARSAWCSSWCTACSSSCGPRTIRWRSAIQLKEYLDLVAMGTVADLVPLVGENRILARHGLQILAAARAGGACGP